MKRERIGLGLLLVLLAGGLFSSRHMAGTYDRLSGTLAQSGTLALAGDWEGADRLFREAREQWDSSWRLCAALTDHEPMEQIDAQLAQLEIYRQQREQLSFTALCALAASQIEDIGDAQSLNWWNLL